MLRLVLLSGWSRRILSCATNLMNTLTALSLNLVNIKTKSILCLARLTRPSLRKDNLRHGSKKKRKPREPKRSKLGLNVRRSKDRNRSLRVMQRLASANSKNKQNEGRKR
jgi:hypothetical protein